MMRRRAACAVAFFIFSVHDSIKLVRILKLTQLQKESCAHKKQCLTV